MKPFPSLSLSVQPCFLAGRWLFYGFNKKIYNLQNSLMAVPLCFIIIPVVYVSFPNTTIPLVL